MKEARNLPRGPILWIAIGVFGLTITNFPLAWALVFGFSFFMAHDLADLVQGLIAGWLGICASICVDIWRAKRL